MKMHLCSFPVRAVLLIVLALARIWPAVAQNPLPTVTIQASDPTAVEEHPYARAFTVQRTGATTFPLQVFYELSGTASNGLDYMQLGNTVQIRAGAASASFIVTPIDDSLVEGTETVVARIIESPLDCATCGYNIGTPGVAEISIADRVPPGTSLSRFPGGNVYGAPAVAQDGTFYYAAGNAGIAFYARAANGRLKWFVLDDGDASPAVAEDGTVYFGKAWGEVNFEAYHTNGTLFWAIPLQVGATFIGVASPAIAHDGTIYVPGEGNLNKGLHALRPDGTLKWRFITTGANALTPVIGADGSVYFGVPNDGFYAVNSGGTLQFRLAMTGEHIWAALGGDGTIYVVASPSPARLFAFAPDGSKKWEIQIGPGTYHSSAPVIGQDGTIFVVSDRLYAFNSDGSTKWVLSAPANVGHRPFSAAVDSQGNVYAGLADGFVAVSPSGSLLWTFPIFTGTAPTLTPDGVVYVGTGDAVYALQANAGLAQSPWPMFQRDPRHTGAAPLAAITIVARDPFASEGTNFWSDYPEANTWQEIWNSWHVNVGGANTASFVVRREGLTNVDLTVNYEIGGTASNGVDYATLSGAVTLPAGKRSAQIVVVPVNDTLVEGVETVVLKLSPSPDYSIGLASRAAAILIDNDQPRPLSMLLPDHEFHLWQAATNGFCFRIDASSDLKHWLTLCSNIVTDGALHFVDPDAPPFAARFYRITPEAPLTPDD